MRDKHRRFVDLAQKRVSKAIHILRLVGNLSNRNNYEYTEDQAQKILRALETELKDVRRRFVSGGAPKKPQFKL